MNTVSTDTLLHHLTREREHTRISTYLLRPNSGEQTYAPFTGRPLTSTVIETLWEGTKSALVLTTDELTGAERGQYPDSVGRVVEHIHQVISPATTLPETIAVELDTLSERIFTTIYRVVEQYDPNADSALTGEGEMILNELRISIEPTGTGTMTVQAHWVTAAQGEPEQITGTHPMGEVLTLPAAAFVHPNTSVKYSTFPNRLDLNTELTVLAEPVWEPVLKEWEGRAIERLQNLMFAAEVAAAFTEPEPHRFDEGY